MEELGKFAFILCGPDYDPVRHRAAFKTPGGETLIVTVRNFSEAVETARDLVEHGVGAIELCGAFGPERCREIIEATGGRAAVGYVTHFPDQDGLFERFFG